MNAGVNKLTLLLVLLIGVSRQAALDLLNLRAHWLGRGVSVLYPKELKLLSQKLTSQVGMMTSYNLLPAGKNWELRGDIKLQCSAVKSPDKEQQNDAGIALWLNKMSVRPEIADYNFEAFSNTFGLGSQLEGLSLVFFHNNLYTSLFRSSKLSREDLLNRSKVCRAYLEKEKEIKFAIKYRANIIGVYFIEPGDRTENLCFQFTDVKDFDQFYISLGATDLSGNCSAEVFNLVLNSDLEYQLVPNEQKRPEDPTFSYFPEGEAQRNLQYHGHFHKVYDLYRETAKIAAKTLMSFADKNEKELILDLKAEMFNTTKVVDKAVQVVEAQARQIELLNEQLTVDRRTSTESIDSVLDQILGWMGQMDEAFDRVDSATQSIHEVLSRTSFNEKIEALAEKVQKTARSISKVLTPSAMVNKNREIGGIEETKIIDWHFDVQSFFADAKSIAARGTTEKVSGIRSAGMAVLGLLAVVLVLAFCVMYLKIKKAMRYKRIL